jgi:lipoprotein LpqB-like beta-propeller protein/sporulation and spore germination protein
MSIDRRARSRASTHSTAAVVASLLAVLSVLSGCATIPTSGPVVPGREVEADPRAGVVQVVGEAPVPGATPSEIVSGFLRNAAGFGDNHEQARGFLTPTRQLAWRPDASVKVYRSQYSLNVRETPVAPPVKPAATATPAPGPGAAGAERRDLAEVTRVTVKTPIMAKIDIDGRYTLAAPGETVTEKFSLIRVDGEWRIDALADGILIGEGDFGVTFRPFPVYFGDRSGRYLVPDVHWFPGTQDASSSLELPTTLVRVLLQGPPPWLNGAVVTGAPAGTRMAVAAVVVSDDVATVDLTSEVRLAKNAQRQLLASQLEATLARLGIASVEITVLRVAYDIPARPAGAGETDQTRSAGGPVVNPRVDSRPVVIDPKGRLARLTNGTLESVPDVDELAVPGANRPAVSSDSSQFAVLNAARNRLLLQLPGTKMLKPIAGVGLSAPSFDPQGWVWTSPADNAGFVYAAEADAGAVRVKAPWMRQLEVVSLRVSRDGTRAVIAAGFRGVAHLFLTGVVRDGQGRPKALNYPTALFPDLSAVRDVAWVDEDQVVVLGRRRDSAELPWVVTIGGSIQAGAPAPGAESIAAGNDEQSLMAGTSKGILARTGALWDKISPARWPAYPG